MEILQNRQNDGNGVQNSDYPKAVRLPLWELFIEERKTTITTISFELDGLPAESYCVWRHKTEEEECHKKISGGGSISRKWNFRYLLNRSIINSNGGKDSDGGKDSFVFLKHGSIDRTKENEKKRRREAWIVLGGVQTGFCGIFWFGNVNGSGINLQPH